MEDDAPVNVLDDGHLGAVAAAEVRLQDARVATLAEPKAYKLVVPSIWSLTLGDYYYVRVTRTEDVKQLVDGRGSAHDALGTLLGGEVALLRQSHHLVGHTAQLLGLGKRRVDALVLDQLRHHRAARTVISDRHRRRHTQ